MPGESRSTGIQTSLLSPLLTETESPFDLEQQWQDLMSIMEMQVSSRWGGFVGRRLLLQARVAALLNLGSMAVPSTRFLGSRRNWGWSQLLWFCPSLCGDTVLPVRQLLLLSELSCSWAPGESPFRGV